MVFIDLLIMVETSPYRHSIQRKTPLGIKMFG